MAHFDHEALHKATKVLTRNLNKVIDINSYPIPEAETFQPSSSSCWAWSFGLSGRLSEVGTAIYLGRSQTVE
jgi:hypothetical protein